MSGKIWFALIAAVAAACAPASDDAPPPIQTGVADAHFTAPIDAGRARIASLRDNAHYPSVSVAVWAHGAIVWTEALGYRDLEADTPATVRTRYPIGSVSKTLTASAVMRLVADGVIDLDQPIEAYWPDTPTHYRGVTMRQLLSHQAGVRHYGLAWTPPAFSEAYTNVAYESVEAGLAAFIEDEPRFAPDQSFLYSTYGYSLASRITEAATGEDFLPLMDRVLFAPLDLRETAPDRPGARGENVVTEYMAPFAWGPRFRAPPTNSSAKWAGGGFVSTPRDLAIFAGHLLTGDYLSSEAFAEMTTPRTMANGETNPQRYGLGWRDGQMRYPRGSESTLRIVHHGGRAAGSECMLMLVPDRALAVALCGNAFTEGGSSQLGQVAADILRDFLETPTPPPVNEPSQTQLADPAP